MKKYSQKLLCLSFIAFLLFIINKIIFTLSVVKEKLYNNKAHFYQWKFGKIFYSVQGKGPNVLLIHDNQADCSAYEFHRIANKLSTNYRVYSIDLLGYGRSDKPKITYTAYLFVQLIIDFRKTIIKDQCSLITSGNSNTYATMACYQNPQLFKNLIFINPADMHSIRRNPKRTDKFLKLFLESPLLGTTVYNIFYAKPLIRKRFTKRIYNPLNVKATYIDAYNEAAHLNGTPSKFTFASQYCAYMNVSISDTLPHINNNIAIIQGTKRSGEFEAIASDYKRLNPAIECSTIDRASSLPHLEKPDSTLELLSVYLH